MTRTTVAELESLVKRINEAAGMPTEPATRTEDPMRPWKWNIGAYTLSGAYGGYKLDRIDSAGGGTHSPLGCYYRPKAELAGQLRAFLTGIEAGTIRS